ncbi:MAG TPA: SDR family oxidoreductase [Bryobacteraceae bacterium]|nr:SDR family oxidoreductase [Bryobacteraceae bacterium]
MVALVTGGGRGIGRGIALGLAKAGWPVAVTARSADELDETVRLSAGRMIAAPADITDPAAVSSMIRRVEAELGPVELLVNNAGMGGPLGPFWESDPAEWWRNQEVNLRGPMLCCREILPGMIARKSGRIINVVSGAGCQAFPDLSAYVVSKTALVRFSEQLAAELAPHGVSVFPIRPGMVRTRMLEEARPRLAFIQQTLDRGLDVTPEVVSELVLKLASGSADTLSGRLFSVGEDVDDIVRHADEVRSGDLYLLRARTL